MVGTHQTSIHFLMVGLGVPGITPVLHILAYGEEI